MHLQVQSGLRAVRNEDCQTSPRTKSRQARNPAINLIHERVNGCETNITILCRATVGGRSFHTSFAWPARKRAIRPSDHLLSTHFSTLDNAHQGLGQPTDRSDPCSWPCYRKPRPPPSVEFSAVGLGDRQRGFGPIRVTPRIAQFYA